jgi:hypothetical protein
MLLMPQPPGVPSDGENADHPLRLDGVTATDFKTVLRMAMPLCVVPFQSRSHIYTSNISGYPSAPPRIDELTTVLRLTTMWQMSALRDEALSRLAPLLSEGEKLEVADQYDVPQWYFPALYALASRDTSLTEHDIEKLGANRAAKIARLRERKLRPHGGQHTSGCGCPSALFIALSCDELRRKMVVSEQDIADTFGIVKPG